MGETGEARWDSGEDRDGPGDRGVLPGGTVLLGPAQGPQPSTRRRGRRWGNPARGGDGRGPAAIDLASPTRSRRPRLPWGDSGSRMPSSGHRGRRANAGGYAGEPSTTRPTTRWGSHGDHPDRLRSLQALVRATPGDLLAKPRPRPSALSRQYMARSSITRSQRVAAEASRDARPSAGADALHRDPARHGLHPGRGLSSEVSPAAGPGAPAGVPGDVPDVQAFVGSTAAARVNGYLGAKGRRQTSKARSAVRPVAVGPGAPPARRPPGPLEASAFSAVSNHRGTKVHRTGVLIPILAMTPSPGLPSLN